jgi:hypothetical protein
MFSEVSYDSYFAINIFSRIYFRFLVHNFVQIWRDSDAILTQFWRRINVLTKSDLNLTQIWQSGKSPDSFWPLSDMDLNYEKYPVCQNLSEIESFLTHFWRISDWALLSVCRYDNIPVTAHARDSLLTHYTLILNPVGRYVASTSTLSWTLITRMPLEVQRGTMTIVICYSVKPAVLSLLHQLLLLAACRQLHDACCFFQSPRSGHLALKTWIWNNIRF